jgi:hypothetical protein
MVLENFLDVICKDFSIKYQINRDKNITTLFVEDKEDRLHKFADYLASNLPLSVFLKSTNVEIVERKEDANFILEKCSIALPYTKIAILLAKDNSSIYFNNPFTPNEIGLTSKGKKNSITLSCKKWLLVANDVETYKKVYESVANFIKNNEKVKIKTTQGYFTFFKLQKDCLKNIKDFEIIPTDLSIVSKMVVVRENELQALVSLEKPTIRAKINAIYEAKDILENKRVKIRMSNSILLQFICEELYKIGVEYIIKTKNNFEGSCLLDFEADLPRVSDMEVCILKNDKIFLLNGSRFCLTQTRKELKKFKNPSAKQFASILKERELFLDKTSYFYFSKENDDIISYHDDKKGVLEFVKFPTFSSVKQILEDISNLDDISKKLITNYKNNFNDIYKKAMRTKIPKNLPNNLYTSFAFASIILGFSDDFTNAAEELIQNAEDFGGQKGCRIDYYLQDAKKIKSDFNAYKLIKSAISFKLGSTDDAVLSFGFLESLAYFISDIADAHKETLGSSKIALGGSMFGYKILSEQTCKNLLANHKIYFNQELPIDNI